MQQSCLDIGEFCYKFYTEALYQSTSNKGRVRKHYTDVSDIHASSPTSNVVM